MFASLSLEREPFTLHDLPAGFVSWLQDAGGFAMAFLVLMAFRRYILGRRATQSSGDAPSPFFSLLFRLAVIGAIVSYGALAVIVAPMVIDQVVSYMTGESGGQPAAPLAGPQTQGLCMAIGGGCALFAILL